MSLNYPNEVFAVVSKTFFNDSDAGFCVPIAQLIDDSDVRQVNIDDFPNKGNIRIREGLKTVNLSDNLAKVIKLTLTEDNKFDASDAALTKWFVLYERHIKQANRWDFMTVIETEVPDRNLRKITISRKPTEFIMLRDKSSRTLYGPFRIVKSEDEFDGGEENYVCEVEPIQTAAIPEPFNEIYKGEQFCILKISETAQIIDAIFESSEGDFISTKNIFNDRSFSNIELIDYASTSEIKRWVGKSLRYLENPKEYHEHANQLIELFEAEELSKSSVFRERISRIKNLGKNSFPEQKNSDSISSFDWNSNSDERNKFVEENIEELLEKYPKFKKHKIEHEEKVKKKNTDLNSIQKEITAARRKNIQAQEALKDILANQEEAKDRLQNLELEYEIQFKSKNEELGSQLTNLEDAIESKKIVLQESIGEKENIHLEIKELEKVKKQIELHILQEKEKNTLELIKHASLTDALAGRKSRPRKLDIPHIDLEEKISNDDEVREKVFSNYENILTAHGRNEGDDFKNACQITSILQNYLTIFYGPPGSGKTSLANISANFLCDQKLSASVFVPVQKGWSSTAKLLGFDNPLTKSRQPDSYGFFASLETFNRNSILFKEKFEIIILDEANLSPIEHYWSDFVGKTDNFYKCEELLNVADEDENTIDGLRSIKIPPGQRFIATINLDHTTENISDRLLSRANFVEIVQPDRISTGDEGIQDVVTVGLRVSDVHRAFYLQQSIPEIDSEATLVYLKTEFSILSVSPRKETAVRRFLSVMEKVAQLYDKSPLVALDAAFVRLIIPTLRGSGSDYRDLLVNLSNEFRERGLPDSAMLMGRIIERGNNTGFYQGLIG